MSPALDRILGPTSPRDFFRDYWAQKPLLVQNGGADRFDGLFGPDDVETYLFVVRPPAGDIQLVRQGQWPPLTMAQALFSPQNYDVQAAYNGFAAGYTMVLNAIHLRWPAARRLVAELEDRLLATIQTNVYVTGPNAQGFAVHQDDHDVFVLQTHGVKRWQIYDKPVAGQPLDRVLVHDVELRRGDMLYLPTGFPHAASTSGDTSIHVTVGVFPLTWLELGRQALGSLAQQDPRWSEPVPLPELGAATGPDVAEMRRRLDQGLSSLAGFSGIIEGYRHGLSASARRKNPAPGGYLSSLATVHELTPEATVEHRPGVTCVVTADAEHARVHFMGETITAPLKAADALRYIAAHPRFRISDIDGVLNDQSKVTLVGRLIREGLLELATS